MCQVYTYADQAIRDRRYTRYALVFGTACANAEQCPEKTTDKLT